MLLLLLLLLVVLVVVVVVVLQARLKHSFGTIEVSETESEAFPTRAPRENDLRLGPVLAPRSVYETFMLKSNFRNGLKASRVDGWTGGWAGWQAEEEGVDKGLKEEG
ncbi:hypothetical protein M0802_000386 [Mischocyttarus mexicanus]|nr:hypothetical protein M0802_000386 [Mischocyttarus mexicanus]